MKKELEKRLIENFIGVLPSLEELNEIEKKIELIYQKRYKKIVFYAMGATNQIIFLLCKFYSLNNHDFQTQIISDHNSSTTSYLAKELQNNSLVVFCSRSGNTHEIINQLKKILLISKEQNLLSNVLILADSNNKSKISVIAKNNNIEHLNIKNAECGRFECTNSVFFFMTELLNKTAELSILRTDISDKNFYETLFNEMCNIEKLLSDLLDLNHKLIIYSSNEKLDSIVGWFKHLWYESFGKTKINLHFDNYSSMFHSSIQHYLERPEDKYTFIHLYYHEEESTHLQENLITLLKNPQIIKIKIEQNPINLLKGIVKLIGFMVHVAKFFEINILDQKHVDTYKKKSLEKLPDSSSVEGE